MVTIPNGKGAFVIHGYDTEKDEKKAKKDIERFLMVLSEMSLYEMIQFLAPYRAQAAKTMQEEYNELVAREEAQL